MNDTTMAKRRTGIDDQAEKQFVNVKCKENYHKRKIFLNLQQFVFICPKIYIKKDSSIVTTDFLVKYTVRTNQRNERKHNSSVSEKTHIFSR